MRRDVRASQRTSDFTQALQDGLNTVKRYQECIGQVFQRQEEETQL